MNYVVQPGDTLWSIASRFNAPMNSILRAKISISHTRSRTGSRSRSRLKSAGGSLGTSISKARSGSGSAEPPHRSAGKSRSSIRNLIQEAFPETKSGFCERLLN